MLNEIISPYSNALDVVSLKFGHYLQQLDESEVLLLFVLHPEGAAPHVDPAEIHVCALSLVYVWYIYLVLLEQILVNASATAGPELVLLSLVP